MEKEIKFSLVYRDMFQSSGKFQPLADQLEKVAPAIEGKTIVKEIVVPGKIINIVIK